VPSINEFVGAVDSADIFKVNVTQPGEIRVNITNPTMAVSPRTSSAM